MTDEPLYATWGFTDAEWGLLVGLPQSVLTAASVATHDSARKTRAENEAGPGEDLRRRGPRPARWSPASPSAALSQTGDPELGEEAPVIEPADPIGYAEDVLGPGRAGRRRCWPARPSAADAETYKHWLVEIADTVVGAASTGGVLGLGGETVTDSERSFRDDLAKSLAD